MNPALDPATAFDYYAYIAWATAALFILHGFAMGRWHKPYWMTGIPFLQREHQSSTSIPEFPNAARITEQFHQKGRQVILFHDFDMDRIGFRVKIPGPGLHLSIPMYHGLIRYDRYNQQIFLKCSIGWLPILAVVVGALLARRPPEFIPLPMLLFVTVMMVGSLAYSYFQVRKRCNKLMELLTGTGN
ncbi:MAG: hypothetical protein IFK94_00145 [Acidobacteria bacterium]|uniref:Uncharacterized protein n=1 Tax=Candidatus Polarisedimenticola svalbardensis TaxID=2886004 RepID=A0A8J6XXH8_9BACT|nr:hypothetical protein [Candidatus Polarisedimenticola svalbardensis]